MMSHNRHWVSYAIGALLAVLLLLVTPQTWAMPAPSRLEQTVPTRTPRPSPVPTAEPPTEPPPATAEPLPVLTATASPVPTTGTPTTGTPMRSPTPTATATTGRLALFKQASTSAVWPGVVVQYTLTLLNEGTVSLLEVSLTDSLPEELEPLPLPTGSAARWDGRTLRAETPVLPPGGRLVVVFSARVRQNASPGAVLLNTAVATAAGSPEVRASAPIALPPAELPPTGDSGDTSTAAN